MKNARLIRICKTKKTGSVQESDIPTLQILFESIHSNFPPILIKSSDKQLVFLTYSFTWNQITFHTHIANSQDFARSLQICKSTMAEFISKNNLFQCRNGIFISSQFLCDSRADCPGERGEDELGCECVSDDLSSPNHCKTVSDTENGAMFISTHCSALYNTTSNGQCITLGRTLPTGNHSEALWYHCLNGKRIDTKLLHDFVSDCGPDAEDEAEFVQLLTANMPGVGCSPGQLPCKTGHSRCYNISGICVYRLDEFGTLYHCRTGEHMEGCKAFQCNKMFKCPMYYCIPFSYVCDGKIDCPRGKEEMNCQYYGRCTGLLLCRSSTSCVHPDDRCDGFRDCPLGEDEQMCDLMMMQCPGTCSCLTFAIFCLHTSVDFMDQNLENFHSIYLEKCVLHAIPSMQLRSAYRIGFRHSSITTFCGTLPNMIVVQLLDISHNQIEQLNSHCFANHDAVISILLNHNQLKAIARQAFKNLIQLQVLNISNNLLRSLPESFIESHNKYPDLAVISLDHNPLTQLDIDMFLGVQVDQIQTDDYHVCCVAPEDSQCFAAKFWFQSCSNLLSTLSIKLIIIFNSLAIFLGNLVSVVLQARRTKDSENKSFKMVVVGINISDVWCSVYLSILWVADTLYGREFVVHEREWRSSAGCFSAFHASLWFSFMSPVLLSFMSLSRLLVVTFPLNRLFRSEHFTERCLLGVFMATLLSSLILVLVTYLTSGCLPTGFCLPFVDPADDVILIKVNVWIVTIVQVTCLLFISINYIILLLILKQHYSDGFVQSNKQQKHYWTFFPVIADYSIQHVVLDSLMCCVHSFTVLV